MTFRRNELAASRARDDNSGFPPGLAQPAIRALHGAGITNLDQLTKVTEDDLLKLHGMGPNAMGLLRDALKERGKSFAESAL